jgi:hypothetical protein
MLFLRVGVLRAYVPHSGKHDRMMQVVLSGHFTVSATRSGVLILQIGVARLVLWHGSRKNHRRCVLWFRVAL